MAARFQADGIAFQYPENWQFEQEVQESGWTVTVQSPDTAFLTVTFDAEKSDIGQMADSALATLVEEYPGLEAESVVESIADQPAIGHDVQFFSFDLTNTAAIRAFQTEGGAVLIMWQFNDLEQERSELVLKAICKSIVEV